MPLPALASLNLGVVAHVDAGKTSLTERLLFEAGVLDAPGRVDDGTTRTDSLDLERRRGITIRASVTSFALGKTAINVVDTPGHPDFIAEVERSLTVLDAAVLVLSAVEGVQPQTVVLWRALRRLGVPTLLFVNKIDRRDANTDRVLEQVRRRLSSDVVVLTRPEHEGRREARVHSLALTDESVVAVVAETDEGVLEDWVGGHVRAGPVRAALVAGVRRGRVAPVLCGSAITGAGMAELRQALGDLLPRAPEPVGPDGQDGPVAATVFAVDRDERGRRTWLRLWSGQVRVRDRVVVGSAPATVVTEVAVSRPGGLALEQVGRGGEIVAVRGLSARIGDTVGCPPDRRVHRFAPATLQAVVEPVDPTQRTALFTGLTELAEEDPLIDLRVAGHGPNGSAGGEAAVSLHGEVQKEVLGALLQERYGVSARFSQTSVVCLERVCGWGAARERLKVNDNPYLAGLGLRVAPAAIGSGVGFSPGVERGNLPRAFVEAAEVGVRAALHQGLCGWEVTDCIVTMTESAYWPRMSRPHQKFDKSMSTVAADFRHLGQVVVMAALARARTVVCRPVDRFDLELPDEAHGPVAAALGRLGAVVLEVSSAGGYTRLVGDLPSVEVPALAARLPDLTGGEGVLSTRLDHHAPAPTSTPVPTRAHTGPDPRDRAAWFRDVLR